MGTTACRTVSPDSAQSEGSIHGLSDENTNSQPEQTQEQTARKNEKKYVQNRDRVDSGICIAESDIILVRRARRRKPVSIKLK